MNISGKCTIYAKEFNGKVAYSTKISQKNINGEWKYLDYLPNTSWNDIAYIIKANSQTTKKLNLENTYGELWKGTYRIIKTMFSENGKNTDIYSNEFEIK